MNLGNRWQLIWWGFNTFRINFKKTTYLPTKPVFDSWDIGPWEIRHFYRMKYRYPTAAPLMATMKKYLSRKGGGK